jgi:hypothetical protein
MLASVNSSIPTITPDTPVVNSTGAHSGSSAHADGSIHGTSPRSAEHDLIGGDQNVHGLAKRMQHPRSRQPAAPATPPFVSADRVFIQRDVRGP